MTTTLIKRQAPLTAKKLAKVTSGAYTYIFNRTAYGDWAIELPNALVTPAMDAIEDLDLSNPDDARQLKAAFNKVLHQHCTREYKDTMEYVNIIHSKKSRLGDLFLAERELLGAWTKLSFNVGRFYSAIYDRSPIQGAGYVNIRNIDTISKYLPYSNYRVSLPIENKLNAICITNDDIRAVIMPIRIDK